MESCFRPSRRRSAGGNSGSEEGTRRTSAATDPGRGEGPMETVGYALLLLFAPMAIVFWGLFGWALGLVWRLKSRGIEPTKVQVEAVSWSVALATGFTGFALVGLALWANA